MKMIFNTHLKKQIFGSGILSFLQGVWYFSTIQATRKVHKQRIKCVAC